MGEDGCADEAETVVEAAQLSLICIVEYEQRHANDHAMLSRAAMPPSSKRESDEQGQTFPLGRAPAMAADQ